LSPPEPSPGVCGASVDSVQPTSLDGVQYVQVFHWLAIAAPNSMLCVRDSLGVVTGEYLLTWPERPPYMPRDAWERWETLIDTAYVRPGLCEAQQHRFGMTVCRARFAEQPDWAEVLLRLDLPGFVSPRATRSGCWMESAIRWQLPQLERCTGSPAM
jgi:hypothetical protein